MGARSGWFTVQSETCFSGGRQRPMRAGQVGPRAHIELVLVREAVHRILLPDPAPGNENLRQRRLHKVLGSRPVAAQ
jgi:hypothetical protein